MDRHGEREPYEHARRVGLDRLVDEFTDIGEFFNFRHEAGHVRRTQADDGTCQVDVVAPAEFRVETSAQFQQRRYPPVDGHAAGIGLQRTDQDLQQRRLAAAIAADDSNSFARRDVEVDVVQRMEHARRLRLHAHQAPEPVCCRLQQALRRTVENAEDLADTTYRNHRRSRQRRIYCLHHITPACR